MKRYEDEHRKRKKSRLDILWVIAVLALFLFIILTGLLSP